MSDLFSSVTLPSTGSTCDAQCACSTTSAVANVFDGQQVVRVLSDESKNTRIPLAVNNAIFSNSNTCGTGKHMNIDNVCLQSTRQANSKPYEQVVESSYSKVFQPFVENAVPVLSGGSQKLVTLIKTKVKL